MEIDARERPLAQIIARELECPSPPEARALADAIRERVHDVECVLFYGSCLRKQSAEGVLDFYVLVGSYRKAYDSWLLAAGNAILPPNVFYIEVESEWGTLRAKYAVLSSKDFEQRVGPAWIYPYIWARFSQPAPLPYARDDEAPSARPLCDYLNGDREQALAGGIEIHAELIALADARVADGGAEEAWTGRARARLGILLADQGSNAEALAAFERFARSHPAGIGLSALYGGTFRDGVGSSLGRGDPREPRCDRPQGMVS